VREGEAPEARSLGRDPRVLGEGVALEERQPRTRRREEGDVLGSVAPGELEPVAVEADGALQVGDAERDERDARVQQDLLSRWWTERDSNTGGAPDREGMPRPWEALRVGANPSAADPAGRENA
jgi:hypothetical protein